VFHCFQWACCSAEAFAKIPAWVIEGGAEWAAAQVMPMPDLGIEDRYRKYLTNFEFSLFRSAIPDDKGGVRLSAYEAIGFWAHLAESGVDPWTVFRSVWTSASTAEAFELAGANTDTFLDTWASSFLHVGNRTRAWTMEGRGVPSPPDAQAIPRPLVVPANGDSSPVRANAYAIRLFAISTSADVIEISVTGHGRLSDVLVDRIEVTGSPSRYCLRGVDGCECPNVPEEVPLLPLQRDSAVLALTGGPDATEATVTGMTLQQHCQQRAGGSTGTLTEVCPSAAAVNGVTGRSYTLERIAELPGRFCHYFDLADPVNANQGVILFFPPGDSFRDPGGCEPIELPGADTARICRDDVSTPRINILIEVGDHELQVGAPTDAEAIAMAALVVGGQ
jgi:hypothetical protein